MGVPAWRKQLKRGRTPASFPSGPSVPNQLKSREELRLLTLLLGLKRATHGRFHRRESNWELRITLKMLFAEHANYITRPSVLSQDLGPTSGSLSFLASALCPTQLNGGCLPHLSLAWLLLHPTPLTVTVHKSVHLGQLVFNLWVDVKII